MSMVLSKQELVEDINELLDDRLSIRTEIALKRLTIRELCAMRDELDSLNAQPAPSDKTPEEDAQR